MSAWLAGWRLALRIAGREARRSRARSIIVLVMIALPVLAVSAADIVLQTQSVSSVESLDRRLGSAQASVTVEEGSGSVIQAPDPDDGSVWQGGQVAPVSAASLSRLLGGARLLPERLGDVQIVTEKGRLSAAGTEVDLTDPLTVGLFRLTSGRLPEHPGEVVVNQSLAERGYAIGDVLDTADERAADQTVVGIAESSTLRDRPVVAGPIGSLHVTTYGVRTWLVDGGRVSWSTVRELNRAGATVLSRAVVTDPPPLPPEARAFIAQSRGDVIAAVVLIVVMALIEVVLLAGPAFAVGARRQAHSLALMASAGGTPAQTRRVVLAGAVVLGGIAAVLGVLVGVVVSRVLVPVLQRWSGTWFGPFEVPWLHLVGVAGFGLMSALLAALVPATIASRQNIVAVLSGRRGDRRPSVRSPLLGVLLLGVGVAGAAAGSQTSGTNGAYLIAGAAIASVLGMILLVPVVLVLVSRLSAALPLMLRYAARDAARHRTRTVPAVAAVAATVAGVVALGIALSSDDAQNEAEYTPSFVNGVGVVAGSGDFTTYERLVQREIPDATVTPVRGIPNPVDGYHDFQLSAGQAALMISYASTFGSDVLVSDGALPVGLLGVTPADRIRAETALAEGRVVVFSGTTVPGDVVRLRYQAYDGSGKRVGDSVSARLPVTTVSFASDWSARWNGPQAIVPSRVANRLGLPTATVGLTVSGTTVSAGQEAAVVESLAGASGFAGFTVERGYQTPDSTRIVQWVLFGLGAILMLGGTLTATFLALSDARPDLATLAAVGATPGMRRGVAAAYALVVGVVGAVLGVGVGFIPGIAVTYPLTGNAYAPPGVGAPDHYLAVPWLMVGGLVLALPLLTALVVGAAVRSRLPLVARLG